MEKLPNVAASWRQSTAISRDLERGNPSEIASLAKNLLGYFRTGEASDPDVYTAGIIAVLSDYPIAIIRQVVDPRTGLPSKFKWLPAIAEVKEACETEMEPIRRQRARDAQIERQLAERAEYQRIRSKA